MPVVRPAGAEDADALAWLRWTWCREERGAVGAPFEDFRAGFGAWWRAHPAHLAWLASPDRQPVGMAFLAVQDRVPSVERAVRRSGWIQSVYVQAEHRGRGLGAALLAAAAAEAERLGLDYVAVHPSQRSVPLYRRAGFGPAADLLLLRLR